MKTRPLSFVMILLALLIAACAQAPTPTQAPTPEAVETAEPAVSAAAVLLKMTGLEESRELTLADLQALPTVSGWGGTKSSAGVISPPQQLQGVSVTALADLVGGLQPGMGVSIVAKDGYAMTMSYEQIAEGDFITYDPGTGDENTIEGALQTIVAYQRDGEPIPADEDGPLRLFIVSPDNDNVVDGHWTVKWVSEIRLKPMSEEWSLTLEGAISESMDRNTFESCSAPGCHQATWTDADGNEWSGVPLYYLAGRVDDGVRHEDRAYNDIFAKAGYVLQVFAADGYNVGIDSSRTDFNRDLFVASIVNGEPLEEKYFPLRLVGEGLEKSEMVGQLAQIVIQPNEGVSMPDADEPAAEAGAGDVAAQPPAATETPGEPGELALPEGAALLLFGQVQNRLALGLENLQAMNVVELQAEHPKQGVLDYRGVRLADLLALAGASPEASTLVITASDGYAAEASLAEVAACSDCLLALAEDGTLLMVMPGMQSNLWVKQVNFLEVK